MTPAGLSAGVIFILEKGTVPFPPAHSALLEIAGPKDGKSLAYVKKFGCLSAASFTNFSKPVICQGNWKTGLAFLVRLWR